MPNDFGFEWTGITYQELKAGSIADLVFALAIVFVFLILAAQYESWTMPFMVLLAVPLALFGALLALWVRQMQIDVYSQIGFVMLIGLAAKNAILIVEFAKRRREEGLEIVEAAMEAGRLRLAPDPDDRLRLHPRRLAAGVRQGRRRGEPAIDRDDGVWRHGRRDDSDADLRSGVLRNDRTNTRGRGLAAAATRKSALRRSPQRRRMNLEMSSDAILENCSRGLRRRLAPAQLGARLTGARRLLSAGAAGAATQDAAMMAMPAPVTKIVKKTLPIYLEYSARTESIGNLTLQAKVSGYLMAQLAPDGADVKQGDLLYRIDPRDFQAALDQANAQAESDTASLDYLRSNFDRGNELAKNGFLAKDAFDQRGSNLRQAEAALAMDQRGDPRR